MQAMGTRSDSTGKNWVKRGLNLHLPLFFCQKCCKPVSNIYSRSRVSSSNKAIVGVDYLGTDILNSASRILQCWSYYVKINSARHQHDTKQSGIVAIDSCFVLFGARQYGVTTRDQALMKKYPRTLILGAFIKLEPWGSWAVSISLSPKLSVWKISCRLVCWKKNSCSKYRSKNHRRCCQHSCPVLSSTARIHEENWAQSQEVTLCDFLRKGDFKVLEREWRTTEGSCAEFS